ncbi:twin-arginine translocase TatA/TatE family subunit [Desulfopila sp. IMCC35008]|uniref:twin-arginine translocase TatA/TatE family subunit n=1 Tax=Desulfopila sp. IMCC35008 TaxID=2653858 RepID=UPI0013D3FAE4|nr:twin-arginine translocase TatA/TatE family subunit [Desulfopila sp. IMCC35008]
MFGIGLPEMILILALALIFVGPDKLPELARSIAKGVMELKKTAEGLKDQLKEEGNPLDDIKPDLENAAKAFQSHLLDHPDKGSTSLFPAKGVNPDNSAADALAEIEKSGVSTTESESDLSEPIELNPDDLSEVIPQKESHPDKDKTKGNFTQNDSLEDKTNHPNGG